MNLEQPMKRYLSALSLLALLGISVAALAQTPVAQLVSVSPRHIFTPTVAGPDSVFTVTIDNPADSPVTEARVYDITGAKVAEMALVSTSNYYVLQWNGKASQGGFVHAGIYLYKILIAGHVWSGSVVVAR
jgi:hypothetical protein